MTSPVPRILFGLAAGLIAADVTWAVLGDFSIDVFAYSRLGLLALALFLGGLFYQRKRQDQNLAAMLMGASFLCAFSAAASVLNYFLLTVTGPRMDLLLAAMDRAVGFDWPGLMVAIAPHPHLNMLFRAAYASTLPQIAVLMITLACSGRYEEAYRFCLAVASGALIAIFVWTLAPSFGAESVYTLPVSAARHLSVEVSAAYGRELADMVRNGPGFITPHDMRGLIGFPSYHAVLALLVVWYARTIPWLRWPALILNLLVLASTPIQGGHHLMDVLGGIAVTALAILSVRWAETIRLPSFWTPEFAGSRREAAIQAAVIPSAPVRDVL